MAMPHLEVEGGPRPPKAPPPGLLAEMWATGAWRLLPVIFIYVLSLAILLPVKPEILTDFFASREARASIRCGSFPVGQAPEVCRNAHSDAVWWASASDFVSHSVVSFLLSPVIGRCSDRAGRKPFLALFLLVAVLPSALLAAHINAGVSLLYYFPVQALAGANILIGLCTAFAADLVSPANRAAAIGLNMAAFALALLLGPPIGGLAGTATAAYASTAAVAGALALLLGCVPESLNEELKAGAREKQARGGRWQAPWRGLGILGRSGLFVKLAACTAVTGFVGLGLMELLAQYLQLKLNYSKLDLAVLITAAGASGLLTQTLLLRALMHCLGETRILIIGCVSRVVEQVLLCAAWDRASVLVAVLTGALANLAMPAISSLLSKNIEPWEQGSAQGALYAALALAQGFGPLAFAFLFSGFTRSDSTWTYAPGAPFLFGALLMLGCTGVAWAIDGRAAERGLQLEQLPDFRRKQAGEPESPEAAGQPLQQHLSGSLQGQSSRGSLEGRSGRTALSRKHSAGT